MPDALPADPPSRFVLEWAQTLTERVSPPRRALDAAMGNGRHAVSLARLGYQVFGVDIRLDVVRAAVGRARHDGLILRGWCGDLQEHPVAPERFDLIVVTRYLQRNLWGALARGLTPGGAILYETFTTAQRRHGKGPTSPDHLLAPGELRAAFTLLDILFYEEVDEPEAVARLVAVRPSTQR